MGWCGSLICDMFFKWNMRCWFDTFSCEWIWSQSQLHVSGHVSRWTISNVLLVAVVEQSSFDCWESCWLSGCFLWEVASLNLDCKLWVLNPFHWWLWLSLRVCSWCTWYLSCGCQSLLVSVSQLFLSCSSLVQMGHCFQWGRLVCYRWLCAHLHGLSQPLDVGYALRVSPVVTSWRFTAGPKFRWHVLCANGNCSRYSRQIWTPF